MRWREIFNNWWEGQKYGPTDAVVCGLFVIALIAHGYSFDWDIILLLCCGVFWIVFHDKIIEPIVDEEVEVENFDADAENSIMHVFVEESQHWNPDSTHLQYYYIRSVKPFNYPITFTYEFLRGLWPLDGKGLKYNIGVPIDIDDATKRDINICDAENFGWVSVEDLVAFDYDQVAGPGYTATIRKLLGDDFFQDLSVLTSLKADRIIFGFEELEDD